jgi:serine/threonine-protein kinase CLA4
MRLLANSSLTREDYAKNPQAVLEVLDFYTAEQKRENGELDPMSMASRRGESSNARDYVSSTPRFNAGTGLAGASSLNG